MSTRRARTLTAVAAALALGGCVTSTPDGASGPMGAPMGARYRYSAPTCSAPADLPGHRVQVVLADMGMSRMMGGDAPMGAHMMLRAMPTTVPAGEVSVVAANRGWRTHELVVLPLTSGAIAGGRVTGPDGRVDEQGSLGEASRSCAAGSGDGITAGAVGWLTLRLPAGRYELVCNLRNHYANGMYAELDVS